jgi:hypothetical protein
MVRVLISLVAVLAVAAGCEWVVGEETETRIGFIDDGVIVYETTVNPADTAVPQVLADWWEAISPDLWDQQPYSWQCYESYGIAGAAPVDIPYGEPQTVGGLSVPTAAAAGDFLSIALTWGGSPEIRDFCSYDAGFVPLTTSFDLGLLPGHCTVGISIDGEIVQEADQRDGEMNLVFGPLDSNNPKVEFVTLGCTGVQYASGDATLIVETIATSLSGSTPFTGTTLATTTLPPTTTTSAPAQDKLTASDRAVGDQFGGAVSISGDTAVIGAPGDDDGGSAYVYVYTGGTWVEQAKLVASDGELDDRFGGAVSISGDTAVIGARGDDDLASGSGSAYVFIRTGTTWTQQAKLAASDAAGNDRFGVSVAVGGDTAVIGANGDTFDAANEEYAGSAYVFTRVGTTWTQQAKLTPSDRAADTEFGYSVALSGETAVVGVGLFDSSSSEAAYVFARTGTTWSQQAKLTAADVAADNQFGSSVALSGDTVVIGAHLDSDAGSSSGSAYVFARTGTTWTQQAKLFAADAATFDQFGNAVAISGDTVLIGASADDNDDTEIESGSAYVFTRAGTTWTQQAKLFAADAAADDRFGESVALDGNSAVIGVGADVVDGTRTGSAYVFAP